MLPSISRNACLVSNRVPTVVSSGDPHMNRVQDQTEVARTALGGEAWVGNNYLFDGFPITDIQDRPSAITKYRDARGCQGSSHTYDGEMGRTGGGVFNATARSGTARYRSAFGLMRPNGLIGNNFFWKFRDFRSRTSSGRLRRLRRRAAPGRQDLFWFATEGYRDGLTQNGNFQSSNGGRTEW